MICSLITTHRKVALRQHIKMRVISSGVVHAKMFNLFNAMPVVHRLINCNGYNRWYDLNFEKSVVVIQVSVCVAQMDDFDF